LSLFGSRLAGTARPDSDIDLLVEFEPGWEPGLLGLATMEAELAALLGGKEGRSSYAQDLSRHSAIRSCGPQRFNMRNEDRVRLLHMIEAAESLAQLVAGRSRDDLDRDVRSSQ
jgi:hypothetical protein